VVAVGWSDGLLPDLPPAGRVTIFLMGLAQADVHLYEQMAGVERHAPDDTISTNEHAEARAREPEEDLP
jgi:hypothetical protein